MYSDFLQIYHLILILLLAENVETFVWLWKVSHLLKTKPKPMIIIVFSACINLKFVFEAILASLCNCGCNCSIKAVQMF